MPPTEERKGKKQKRFGTNPWTLDEKKALVIGLKTYGLDDKTKLAEAVKTKNESEIDHFIRNWKNKMVERMKRELCTELRCKTDKRAPMTVSDFANVWAPIEFWSYITPSFISSKNRLADYSYIFREIFATAAENEQHAAVEDKPDFKQIYEYLSSLLGGLVGPQLSPINSMLLLHLIQELTLIIKSQDGCPDEVNYMQSLTGKAEYVRVKPRKKNDCKSSNKRQLPTISSAEGKAPNQVIVSARLQEKLYFHKKVQENLNPFSIPMPLLQKEQEMIRRYYSKS